MPVSERRSASNQSLRATERLAPIPEEDEQEKPKPTVAPTLGYKIYTTLTALFRRRPAPPQPQQPQQPAQPQIPPPTETEKEVEAEASYGDESPPGTEKQKMGVIQRVRWLFRWDIIMEKSFFKIFFGFVYGLAIISYFTTTITDHRSYEISIFLFHRCIAATYLIGFYSIWVQIIGLCGENGILPIKETIEALAETRKPKMRAPTLFWYNQSDTFIHLICCTGIMCSFLYLMNVIPTLMQILAFVCFLSFKVVGREFFALQFDNLLLDTSIWAILLPPIRIIPFVDIPTTDFYRKSILFLVRWLGFRLLVGSGLCKISSGDKTWRNGTALMYHYWSQPMPNWLSYYANDVSEKVQKFSCYYHFFIELAVPFGVFFPPLFVPTFILLASLQVGILLTGNYGFFNMLSIFIPLILVSDSIYPAAIRNSLFPFVHNPLAQNWLMFNLLTVVLVGFVLALSLVAFSQVSRGNMDIPNLIYKLQSRFSRFGLMNYYGLFARMTTTRREVIIEGSSDGRTWQEYELFYKPGDVKRRPPFVIGHLPRLDWRLWFCQFTHFNSFFPGWFDVFLMKLLEGSPEVLNLIAKNPFTDAPPRFLRAVMYDYNFSTPEQRQQGIWWVRSNKKLWWPPCTLHNGKIIYLR